jgi:hypothetical protein
MCGRANLVTAKYYKEFSDSVTAEYSDYTNLENVRLERTPNNIKIGILEYISASIHLSQWVIKVKNERTSASRRC